MGEGGGVEVKGYSLLQGIQGGIMLERGTIFMLIVHCLYSNNFVHMKG